MPETDGLLSGLAANEASYEPIDTCNCDHHPAATIHGSARIGPYTVVEGPVRVNADVQVGTHVHLLVIAETRRPSASLQTRMELGAERKMNLNHDRST